LWDAAAGSQTSSLASGLSAGTYCVTVSDVNNCVVSNCVTITDPAPLNAVPDGSTTICYGDSAQIWASGQGGTPGYTINWSTSGLSGTGPIMVSPLVLTDYCFTVEDANGCVSAAACVTIDVLPPISVDIMPSASICSGDSVTVTASASGGNGGPYTFSWASGAGTGFTPTSSGSPSTIIDNPTTDTWYYVTVSDGCSLDAIDSTLIVLDPTPVAFLNAIDSNGCAPFSASFILNTDIGVNFDYDFDCDGIVDYSGTNTNPTHTYVNAGIYDVCVTVSSAAGCQTQLTASGIVEVYPVPIASFSADPWTATEIDPYIQFYDESFGGSVYSWIFEVGDTVNGVQGSVITSGNTTGTIENPEHFYGSVGTYEVTLVVTNQYGCTDVYVHQVEIELERTIFVPNSFTPNDDGKNDFFIPQGMGLDNENFEMYIFNRWGELIYETHSLNRPWDGRSKNGKKVSKTEVYVWLVKTLDSNGNAIELKGHVTLLK
jgi:gliding motility-associated-like protein